MWVSPRHPAPRPLLQLSAVAFLSACASRPADVAKGAVTVEVSPPAVATSSATAAVTTALAAESAPTFDATRAKALTAERDRCLHDAACSRAETQRLTREAVDLGATGDCAL